MKRRKVSKLEQAARALMAAVRKEREAFSAAGYAREERKRAQARLAQVVGNR